MKEIIKSIIEGIPSGMIFDTHMVIEHLLQNDSDAYLSNYTGNSTELYHSDISKTISKLGNEGLVSRIEDDSWSLNIRKKFSKCACWKKN